MLENFDLMVEGYENDIWQNFTSMLTAGYVYMLF